MTSLKFLGTGGGRFAAILQTRATGGVYLLIEDSSGRLRHFHIDPGPGALVRMLAWGLSPLQTDAILVSHCHPDHYSDAEILIEGMTDGGNKRQGALVASHSVLEGIGDFGPSVSKYHRAKPAIVRPVSPGEAIELFGIKVEAVFSAHSDPASVGFRIHTPRGIIGYISDTALDQRIVQAHAGSRILIIPVTRPLGMPIPYHLTVEDAAAIAGAVKPELALLTHFGTRVIKDGPPKAAEWIQNRTGVRTVAAEDGMVVDIGDELRTA